MCEEGVSEPMMYKMRKKAVSVMKRVKINLPLSTPLVIAKDMIISV